MDDSIISDMFDSCEESSHVLANVIDLEVVQVRKKRSAFLVFENERDLAFKSVATYKLCYVVLTTANIKDKFTSEV
jgi:hypothetical protein